MSSSEPSPAVRAWSLRTQFLSERDKQHFHPDTDPDTWRGDKEIGRGAFGAVWRETCIAGPRQGQVRAVKQIPKAKTTFRYLNSELEVLALFGTAKNQSADLFVQFSGWFGNSESIFIALEFVPYGDLEQHIADRKLDDAEAVVVIDQVTRALKCLHDGGFAHRDLKPGNILVACPRPDWKVKLTDFGVSKNFANADLQTFAGTGVYMAPEVHSIDPRRNRKSNTPYTTAADIWSLGAVAYCTQMGKPPFSGVFEIAQFMRQDTQYPTEGFRFCYPVFAEFVQALMRKSPVERLSATQVLQHEWIASRMQPQSNDDLDHVGGGWGTEANGSWTTTVRPGHSFAGSVKAFGASYAQLPGSSHSSTSTRQSVDETVRPTSHGTVNSSHSPNDQTYHSNHSYPGSHPSWSTNSGATSISEKSSTAYERPGVDRGLTNRSADSLSQAKGPDSAWAPYDSWDPTSASYLSDSIRSNASFDVSGHPFSLRPGVPQANTRKPASQSADTSQQQTIAHGRGQSSDTFTERSTPYAPELPVERKFIAFPKPDRRAERLAKLAESQSEPEYIAPAHVAEEVSRRSTPGSNIQAQRESQPYQQRRKFTQKDSGIHMSDSSPHWSTASPAKATSSDGTGEKRPNSRLDSGYFDRSAPVQEAAPTRATSPNTSDPRRRVSGYKDPSLAQQVELSRLTCLRCGTSFNSRNALFQHIEEQQHGVNTFTGRAEHHQRPPEQSGRHVPGPESNTPQPIVRSPHLSCLRCGESFNSRDDLFQHIEEQQHGVDLVTGRAEHYKRPSGYGVRYTPEAQFKTPQYASKSSDLTCLRCGESFTSRDLLFEHIEKQQHGVDLVTGRAERYQRPPQYGGYGTKHYSQERTPQQNVRPTSKPLLAHLHSNRAVNALTCLTCSAKFEYRDDLFRHLEEEEHAVDLNTGRREKLYR
jgi:serine/threonine protein kinase